ncbi:alpha/beta hydrolase [Desmospora profundinema]|uniref:Carboxylesterase n=1 Tax=Desmospora profundinema TaxID=1571184 RepID=A0ABU1ILL0_9BACL|nr:alpha/beta fold hydrolase [Desmospora profundinema]MDR6225662.1 carboxylesterase [Desmospora profundinema]
MEGYLLLHGFTGSAEDFGELPRRMKEKGGWVRCPVLAGHQGGRSQMRQTTWEDWVDTAERNLSELNRISSQVTVIGFSMGALIAVLLSDQNHSVKRLVLMAPPVFPNALEWFCGVANGIKNRANGTHRPYLRSYIRRYSRASVRSVHEMHRLLRATKPVYGRLSKPTLIIQGARDDIAHPKGAKEIYDRLTVQEKKMVILPQSRHLICVGPERDRVYQEVFSFLSLPDYEEKEADWH